MWNPRPEPSDPELIGSALSSVLTRPTVAWDVLNTGVRDVGAAAEAVAVWAKDTSVGLAKSVYAMIRSPIESPLNTRIGAQRRFARTEVSLEDLQQVHGTTWDGE